MTNEKKKNNSNWLGRAASTGLDVALSWKRGVTKGVEGVADAAMGIIGGIGGIFSEDFKKTMQKAIEFDATGYLIDEGNINFYMPEKIGLNDARKASYLSGNKVGEFVQEGVESIAHMAPGIALSFIPGVGPGLSMAYTGASAGGNAMEEALQNGAGYYNALGYGALSAGTEMAMEKLGGYAFGDATSLLGKATAGTKFGNWASKGIGKAITTAATEGTEEVLTDLVDPLSQYVTGVDTEIGANFRKALQGMPKTFLMGATVGSVVQGGQVLGQNISNKTAGRGGAKATRADSSLAFISESAQNYGKNEKLNAKTDKAIIQGLTDVGVQMTQMSESERAIYRESLGEYKNAFNEDGTLKQDLVNSNVNNDAISRKLQPISATLKHAPISADEQISEGAGQAKAHIEKVLGSKANVVITNTDSNTNAFFNPDENVFYINNKSATLNDADGAIKKASVQVAFHEMTHSAEGTMQYNQLVNEAYRIALDENAPDSIKKRIGSLDARVISAIHDYAEQTKGMSKAKAGYTVETEVIADLVGDLMADDYFVNKLAERDASLVKKLVNSFKNTIKKSATIDSESIKYLKKLVNKFEKALDNAQGGVKISQIGNEDEEKDEAATSSQQSAVSKVEDERYSFNQYSNRQKENWKNSKSIVVCENETHFLDFIKESVSNKQYNKKIYFGSVSDELAKVIEENTGINVKGYNCSLSAQEIRKIFSDHGTDKTEIPRGQRPVTEADILNIPKVIQSPEKIKKSNKLYDNKPVIDFVKNINGKMTVTAIVSDKHLDLRVQTAFVGIKKGNLATPIDEQASNNTPEATRGTVSNTIIPKNTENVKENSENISDERKSVKRSYEPGKESEFEEKLAIRYDSMPGALRAYKKANANKPREKVYSQKEMLSFVDKLVKDNSGKISDFHVFFTKKGKDKLLRDLVQKLNTTDKDKRMGMCLDFADYYIENACAEFIATSDEHEVGIGAPIVTPLIEVVSKKELKTLRQDIARELFNSIDNYGKDTKYSTFERKLKEKYNVRIDKLKENLKQARKDSKKLNRITEYLADNLKSKKYSGTEAIKVMEALLSVDSPLGRSIELKKTDYKEAVRRLKNDLNSKNEGERAGAALELAKFIVQNGMITKYTVDAEVQEAIEFVDDLKPLLDNESISAEDAISKLDELGFDTSGFTGDNVFDAIKTMYDDAYSIIADNTINYRVSIYNTLNAKEAHELTQKIAKEILNSYETFGEETKLSKIEKKYADKINGLKDDLKTTYERNKLENRILREIEKTREIQSGKYVNSTQAKPEVFNALQSLLKKIDSRGQLNRTSTRKILAKLAEWYIPENPMLKSFGAEDSENKSTGFFSQEMYERIQYFVEDKGKERLSITELKEVCEILHHINHIFENYGKIWRGNRYVEALDVAKEYAKKLNIAEKDVPAFARLLFKNAITKNINDPMSVCAAWDGYDENGFFTETYREFAEALIKQKHDEMTALAELAEFEKKNKKYFKALINGKSKVKVMGRINVREGTVDTVEMPKYAAIDLYMTSRTGNAIETFEQTGYKLKLDNQDVEDDFQPISREQIEAMYKDFTEQDKELIKILDKAYNGVCRDLKFDTDIRRLGWSNVFEGVYYPLYRDHSVDFDKDDFNSVMSRVSNVASNHTRVHSKNAIIVSNAITKFMRHVNDVTRYANLAIPVENLNILYNLDIGDNARMPTSIKTRLTKSNFWKGAKEYLFDLKNDVQGVGKELSSGKKAIAWLRGQYAKYQLGANPKVWFSQLSSYFASFGELRIGSLLKALTKKDTYTNSDVDKYCKLAAVRSYERGASSAMAVSEKIGQAGSYLTKPIEFVDRRVVCALFSACQFEAQARYKLDVGTEANKVKAGEILTEVILKTQQNQLVTEQSKVMREKSEIIKSFTMFNADSMKLNSRFCQALGELATINKKLKDAKKANDQQLIKELTEKRNDAAKKVAKYSASIVTIAFYMAVLAKSVQAFRRKDEDEPIGEWLFKEAGLNLLGTIPFFRDVVSFFTDGFEADIFAISMVNDLLKATEEMKNNFADMANGKEVSSQQWLASGKKAAYAIGQIAGFPVRNIYNVVTGWTRRISESTGLTVDSWFKEQSDSDLKEQYKEASAKGNTSLAGKSLDLIYKNHDMELTDAVLKKELDRLNSLDLNKKDDDKSNYSVLAKKTPDLVTFEGEEIELTSKQKNAFKTAYKTAETEAGKMVRVYKYKKLDSESQAYAIRKIYEYHYSKSEEGITGERARLVYFGDIIGMDKLALILGYANSLKGDKDRKTKIEAYIKSMGLISQHASLALRYLGYADKDNDSKVKNFIKARSSLTKEQKDELLEMLKLN